MAQNITATSITVCFEPPLDVNQNGPITSFNITYTGLTVDTTTQMQSLSISNLNVVTVYPLQFSSMSICANLSGLQEFNNYTISVLAINGAGAGPSSSITQLTNQAGSYAVIIILNILSYIDVGSNV